MNIAAISFSEAGADLAGQAADELAADGHDVACARGFGDGHVALGSWVADAFVSSDALLFVGAAGIAVRAIAPYVHDKAHDPAVVVMDEAGHWAIPLLSGHIGGANALARRLAVGLGAQAVLTTATDVRGVWAVDEWAARRGLVIANPARVKAVSATLLAGGEVGLFSDVALEGPVPAGVRPVGDARDADVVVTWHAGLGDPHALHIVVPCVVAGMGCCKGVAPHIAQTAFLLAAEQAHIAPGAVRELRSIDVKAHEPALLELAHERALPFTTLSAAELATVQGSRASSAFVERNVGVDNVCERAALSAGGELVLGKFAFEGVTVAFAKLERTLDFEDGV